MKFVLFVLFLLGVSNIASAQSFDSTCETVVDVYNKYVNTHLTPGLFLHLDKSVYDHSENIWFTAYLLNKQLDTAENHTLYVSLVNLAKKTVIASDRFVFSNGISSGYIYIKDSFPSGEYLLIAYTNTRLTEGDESHYQQQIGIRSSKKPLFSITMYPDKENQLVSDSINLRAKILTDYKGVASGGSFLYNLYGERQLLKSGLQQIDPFGEVNIAIPAKDSIDRAFLLTAEVKRNNSTQSFWQPYILNPEEIVVNYYPEGGDLIDNHFSRIAFEIGTKDGRPLSTEGVLLEDGHPVGNFKTNEYGLGILNCIPHKDKSYTLVLKNQMPGTYVSGHFPSIEPSGFTLSIQNGLVKDSVVAYICAPKVASKCFLMIYNSRSMVYAAKITMHKELGSIAIPAKTWPAGAYFVTLFSEEGLPMAERSILVPGPRFNVSMDNDSLTHHKRSKVELHVKITNEHGIGIKSCFSFACVLASRLNPSTYLDIVRYKHFDLNLPDNLEPLPPLSYFTGDSAIDLVLLTRFWTHYHWYEINKHSEDNPPAMREDDYGIVHNNKKRIKKPVEVMMMLPYTHIIETDSAGNFQIPRQFLIGKPETSAMLTVINEKNDNNYTILLKNDYDSVNRLLGNNSFTYLNTLENVEVTEKSEYEKLFDQAKILDEVVVKGRSIEHSHAVYQSTSCNDYVCRYGILNCPGHPYDFMNKPIAGHLYRLEPYGPFVVYKTTCVLPSIVVADGPRLIHITREFYVPDYRKHSPLEPETYTTIYWAPLVITNDNGEATISYYTNDLVGDFVNILQGVNVYGVFSGRETFRVEQ